VLGSLAEAKKKVYWYIKNLVKASSKLVIEEFLDGID
jgi:hypothetical protein